MRGLSSRRGHVALGGPQPRGGGSLPTQARPAFLVCLLAACAVVVGLFARQLASLHSRRALGSQPLGIHGEHDSARSCFRSGEERTGSSPAYDYCNCLGGQQQNFSRAEVEEMLAGHRGVLQPRRSDGEAEAASDTGGARLLMLAMEREQLTKGRLHLAEALLLARLLNRTFVLPRVGESRIGYDRHLPFCTYFDTKRIARFVDWISDDMVVPHLDVLGGPMFGQVPSGAPPTVLCLMLIKRNQACDSSLWAKLEPQGWEEAALGWKFPCVIIRYLVDLKASESVVVLPFVPHLAGVVHQEGFEGHVLTAVLRHAFATGRVVCVRERGLREVEIATQQLMSAMGSASAQDAPLILVFKVGDLMYFSPQRLQAAEAHVAFAPHLHSIAKRMAQTHLAAQHSDGPGLQQALPASQPPYLAIQWRTEYSLLQSKMDEKRMLQCAAGLVSFATTRLKTLQASAVFLASDVNGDGRSASNTFNNLPQPLQDAARAAIQKVYRELRPLSWASADPFFTRLDNGIQGILDKLMCAGATFFAFAPDACGGKSSSFTRAIIETRRIDRKRWPYSPWSLPSNA